MVKAAGSRQRWGIVGALVVAVTLALAPVSASQAKTMQSGATTYTNPLKMVAPGHGNGLVEDCPDPTVIRGQTPGDHYWYMYCTKDPLNDQDRAPDGSYIFHNISMHRSLDLVHWTYVGDAFAAVPTGGSPNAGLFAPEVVYLNNQYYLYYTVTDVLSTISGTQDPNCNSDSAIFAATSANPTGPWTVHPTPVVEPRYNGDQTKPFGQRDCNFFNDFDPDVITAGGHNYIYYGSYYGGVQVRPLSGDGFTTDAATAHQVTIPNRYEAPEVQYHNGYYYLFVSATNCCNGPLTGYSIFSGRSTSPTGPFVDREGVSLTNGRVGGSPVISMNGNQWVGPGHNTVFTDFAGQDWTIYHAVNRADPYFAPAPGFDGSPGHPLLTKRPALLDPIDYVDGFPTVRGGLWASATPMPAPAAQPGDPSTYQPVLAQPDMLGAELVPYSDEFNGTMLSPQWTWVRQPADASTYGLEAFDGATTFRFDVQAGKDLFEDSNNASVLTEVAPPGDYVAETRVHLNLPPEGCCHNYAQAGLVIYGDDDNFIKLASVSIWETRQTEFAKEISAAPRYGNTVVGPPSDWTYLRIVKTTITAGDGADTTGGDTELFRAYTSQDGHTWVRGGVWTHHLDQLGSGKPERIGLVSMAADPNDPQHFTAHFDYVHVYGSTPSGSSGGGPGAATPELGSGELLATGLLPLSLALILRRRRGHRNAKETETTAD